LLIFLEVTIDNVGDVFSGFLFISTHISLDLLSLGSAETYIERGGKLNGHLMASCVRNILTKNYQNLIIGFQVSQKCRGCFLRHNVYPTALGFEMSNENDRKTRHKLHTMTKMLPQTVTLQKCSKTYADMKNVRHGANMSMPDCTSR